MVAQVDRVAQRFHGQRAFFETRELIEVGDRTQADDQVIVGQLMAVVVRPVGDDNLFGFEIDLPHVAEEQVRRV